MASPIDINAVYAGSQDVVVRQIEGEILIVPLVAGIGDGQDELYTLNETGQAIWEKLDGKRTLKEVAALLAAEFKAPVEAVEEDVLGFARELTCRGVLVAA